MANLLKNRVFITCELRLSRHCSQSQKKGIGIIMFPLNSNISGKLKLVSLSC